ncbi:PREDICTED: histone deacetylase complex subunit SAP18 isoform X2 [Rhagoletis zephyria]|uniref:histone deacetylase complex subunit SAP18 isoform X2 n=1 Tax=Rhagoletis zephyria TaxID=28612 RepID=UPI00081122DF|nr:PREDICTED: histone deacetylase complex subunit SAP18 isoform X2 [Rhagoletis zephyria]XP_036325548.1 histone deacetylase complex subunit SAP18 isoform X2 [Rhagoletis pomonella]
MANVESMIVEEKSHIKPIDREKTCPLLLRVFCSTGRHHSVSEYMYGNVPSNELQIYTWQDATLHELTSLVRDVNPDTRKKGQKGADDTKTLAQAKFCIGDFLDISITPPNRLPPIRRNRPY